jgi:hypothetical protein
MALAILYLGSLRVLQLPGFSEVIATNWRAWRTAISRDSQSSTKRGHSARCASSTGWLIAAWRCRSSAAVGPQGNANARW